MEAGLAVKVKEGTSTIEDFSTSIFDSTACKPKVAFAMVQTISRCTEKYELSRSRRSLFRGPKFEYQ
jgi:hypothetical protein